MRHNERIEKIIDLWNDEFFEKRHVAIDRSKILALALTLAEKELKVPDWRLPNLLPQDNPSFASYLPYICAVNFSFTQLKPPFQRFCVEDETGKYYGSQAMTRCFYRRFGNQPIDYRHMLSIVSSSRLSQDFFKGSTEIPLLNQRRRYLQEVAQTLGYQFNGNPELIFAEADWELFGNENRPGILDLVENYLPKSFGGDCMYYTDLGINVPLRFAKRAQLWMMIYQGRALVANGEMMLLYGSEHLGPIADSAVPNALREAGILRYDPELGKKIDLHMELGNHSPEVREIRMATVVAVRRLLESINQRRHALLKNGITFLALDHELWQIGRNMIKPAHLSRTTDY